MINVLCGWRFSISHSRLLCFYNLIQLIRRTGTEIGKESAGIPEEILSENEDTCIRIPMWGDIRSLNLSNSVAIILYEALSQNGFEKMQLTGELHRLTYK